MALSDLLMEALKLMGVGMLFVGVFLGVLVFLIPLLNKIVPDEPLPAPATRPSTTPTNNTAPEQDALIAVISAAVQQYRNHQK